MSDALRSFLEIPYDQLEELNLAVKQQRIAHEPDDQLREERCRYLHDEKRLKAVIVAFSDLEGRLHMLDYDKKFLLKSADNLTFDGSSVRGFSTQVESDLRLSIDWSAFYWLPADVFGPGKVLVFAEVLDRNGHPYPADLRARLKRLTQELWADNRTVCHVAPEIEGFLFKGRNAEHRYLETGVFEYVSTGGYYHALPGDPLHTFIDMAAEAQRAMGFQNEKDHPEVAPSQFEMNFSYSDALIAADQVQLYKLLCRQVAANLDTTASFLPKPVAGLNGTGMHSNLSFARGGENLYWDANGPARLSAVGWEGVGRILAYAQDLCLVFNPSVNAYRRLDPHFEAPNQIKASAVNRGAMVRIPAANARSARIEVRSVAPDVNPYMVFFALAKTALHAPRALSVAEAEASTEPLPSHIGEAITRFTDSAYARELLGADVVHKYAELKQAQADRNARALGTLVKIPEIQFHHEVTNQVLWSRF